MANRSLPLEVREVMRHDPQRPHEKMLEVQCWPISEADCEALAVRWREVVRQHFAAQGIEFGPAIDLTAGGPMQ